jgi:hypothetical protein
MSTATARKISPLLIKQHAQQSEARNTRMGIIDPIISTSKVSKWGLIIDPIIHLMFCSIAWGVG